MSISSISSGSVLSANSAQDYQSKRQLLKSEFQQLGQDLQAGDLSQAQKDFASLSAALQGTTQNSTGAASQALTNLGQALQANDLSSAQQDYAAILQSAQQGQVHHRHHHHHAGGSQAANSANSQLSQSFATLGQDLQSGNLADAQKAYSTILQTLQQIGLANSASSLTAQATGSNVNLSA